MDARDIVFNYFEFTDPHLNSLMGYLDTDTLVGWFVDEEYVDDLDGEERDFIMEYYDTHWR